MALLLRIVFAVVAGALVGGLLDYFGVLNPQLNELLGLLVGLVVFFRYDGRFPL